MLEKQIPKSEDQSAISTISWNVPIAKRQQAILKDCKKCLEKSHNMHASIRDSQQEKNAFLIMNQLCMEYATNAYA